MSEPVPESKVQVGGSRTPVGTESSASNAGAIAKRPKVIPHKPKDAPQFTDAMTSEDKEKLTRAFLARRRAEGAYKKSSVSAEDVQAGAKSLFEASKTTVGKVTGTVVDELAGVNVVAHAQNALLGTEIAAAATARTNETNIARAEAARVDNRTASKNLHSGVEDWKGHKGEGLLSDLPATGEDRKAAVQNLMDTHGEEEFNRRYRESKGNKAIFAMMKKVAANKRLLAHDKKMGNKQLSGWTQEQTVGEAVPEHMAKELTPGHTIAATDVVASSLKGNLARGVESINPMSDRPLGNTAKLSDEQKMRLETYTAMRDALKQKQSEDLEARAELKKADPSTRGYHPEELTRRAELKEKLAGLDTARSADRAQRIGTDATGYTHTAHENERLDVHNTAIQGITEDQRESEKALHEDTYDELHDKTRGRVRRTIFSGKLPPALETELASSKQELNQLTSTGKSSGWRNPFSRSSAKEEAPPPDAATQLQIEQLRLRIKELETQKASGLSPEEYEKKKSAKAEVARIDKADASELNFSPEARAMLDQHTSSKEDIEFQRAHGLNRQQQEEYDAATEERTSQKSARDTGLTDGEQELMAYLDEQIAGVYDEAKVGRAFVKEHEGETVSSLGRAGGLDSSDNVAPEKMAVTAGGRAAQMARSSGSVVSGTGDVLNASKKSIQKAIDNGELLKASAQLAGSITGDALATAGNVQIPGIGTVSKQALKALGKVLQGSGRAIHAIGDSAAQAQDQRDRQRQLTSGERLAAAHEQAIDFGHLTDKKPDALSEVMGGLMAVANSGFEPIEDAKEQIKDAGTDAANSLVDSTKHGLQSMSSTLPDEVLGPIDAPQMAPLALHEDLPEITMPSAPNVEALSLEEPQLTTLAAPLPSLSVAPLDLQEVDHPTIGPLADDAAENHVDAEQTELQELHDPDPQPLELEPASLNVLKPDPENENEDEEEHEEEHEEEDEKKDDEGGDDEGGDDAEDEEGDEDDEDEEEEEKEEPKAQQAAQEPEEEDPKGFTYHRDYRPLFDRMAERPSLWQRIKRGASNAWSSVKGFFGFGKKDSLADHIGTPMRDRSAKPLFDRLSASQSLSARMGRGASNAWTSFKGLFGSKAAPVPEEDDPASHIGDTIRRRKRARKI